LHVAPLLSAEARLRAKADAGRGRIAFGDPGEGGPPRTPLAPVFADRCPSPQPSPRKNGARGRTSLAEALMTAQPLLDVNDLTVEFSTRRGIVKAVQHVNISVAKGETLGIVGESGSGKSVTSYAVMRILDRAGKIAEGSVMFSGIDVKTASENQMRDLRGREISMIFQNPRA